MEARLPPVYHPALHDERHFPQNADVGQRVAGHGDDIGQVTCLERANLPLPTKQPGAVERAGNWQPGDIGPGYRAAIPAAYTDSPYPLQYYFEVRESAEKAWLYPGFAADLANQPYYVVRRT